MDTTRSARIIKELQERHPRKNTFDLDGQNSHFVCEVEPTSDHPEYDRAIEVIIASQPHKHSHTTQWYTILKGDLRLYIDDKVTVLHPGDKITITPNQIHWAESKNECWVEILSKPGWTKEDHIPVDLKSSTSISKYTP